MKKFTLLLLLIFNSAQADSGRVNLNAQTDDCSLFRALNGSETVPEECKGSDTKSAFAPIAAPQAPQPVVLNQINFNFDSARLTNEAHIDLNKLAKVISDPVSRAQIYEIGGHTDLKGATGYNFKLSKRRAESVRKFLIAHGVPSRQLAAQGYGPSRLLDAQNPYSLVNRRVEIVNITSSGN